VLETFVATFVESFVFCQFEAEQRYSTKVATKALFQFQELNTEY